MTRKPVGTAELLEWIEEDWVGLWELASLGGLDDGVPLDTVIAFVLESVEPGLRAGVIRLGRVFQTPSGAFEPIEESLAETLALIRNGVRRDKPDVDIDLWFDSVPPSATRRRPGVS